jgi:Glycosyl transferase family 11
LILKKFREEFAMIIVRLKGGLGNQMFQYALGRVLAIKNNTPLLLDVGFLSDGGYVTAREYGLDVFNITGRIAKRSEIFFIYRRYGQGEFSHLVERAKRRFLNIQKQEIHSHKFNPGLLKLGSGTYLDGYFQSPKYFAGYEEAIRKDFILLHSLSGDAWKLFAEIADTESLCLHVRRGDYVGNRHHEVVDENYYEEAINRISEKNKIEKIYIFSDDIEWCRRNLQFSHPVFFVDEKYSGRHGEGHMILMSAGKYFVIPNSTFSWWGAWLSDREGKIVVCPRQWFGDASINSDDLIPTNWIKIEA